MNFYAFLNILCFIFLFNTVYAEQHCLSPITNVNKNLDVIYTLFKLNNDKNKNIEIPITTTNMLQKINVSGIDIEYIPFKYENNKNEYVYFYCIKIPFENFDIVEKKLFNYFEKDKIHAIIQKKDFDELINEKVITITNPDDKTNSVKTIVVGNIQEHDANFNESFSFFIRRSEDTEQNVQIKLDNEINYLKSNISTISFLLKAQYNFFNKEIFDKNLKQAIDNTIQFITTKYQEMNSIPVFIMEFSKIIENENNADNKIYYNKFITEVSTKLLHYSLNEHNTSNQVEILNSSIAKKLRMMDTNKEAITKRIKIIESSIINSEDINEIHDLSDQKEQLKHQLEFLSTNSLFLKDDFFIDYIIETYIKKYNQLAMFAVYFGLNDFLKSFDSKANSEIMSTWNKVIYELEKQTPRLINLKIKLLNDLYHSAILNGSNAIKQLTSNVIKMNGILSCDNFQSFIAENPSVKAFIVNKGINAHYSIWAKDFNIPVIMLNEQEMAMINNSSKIAIDNSKRELKIYVNPSKFTLNKLEFERTLLLSRNNILCNLIQQQTKSSNIIFESTFIPKDYDIEILNKNLENTILSNQKNKTHNFCPVRTEGFYYQNKINTITMKEFYKNLLLQTSGKVTIRTFDRQKNDKELKTIFSHYSNSDMLIYSESIEDFGFDFYKTQIGYTALKEQIKIIITAAYEINKFDFQILFPYVKTEEDINLINKLFEQVYIELQDHLNIASSEDEDKVKELKNNIAMIKIGYQIEKQEAMVNVEHIISKTDFISIELTNLSADLLNISRLDSNGLNLKHLNEKIINEIQKIIGINLFYKKDIYFNGENITCMPEFLIYFAYLSKKYPEMKFHISISSNNISESKMLLHFIDVQKIEYLFNNLNSINTKIKSHVKKLYLSLDNYLNKLIYEQMKNSPFFNKKRYFSKSA